MPLTLQLRPGSRSFQVEVHERAGRLASAHTPGSLPPRALERGRAVEGFEGDDED